MFNDLYLTFGLVMIVFSFAGAFIGGFIMKSYIISTKQIFKSEVETFAAMNAEFISKFQNDALNLGQNTLKIQDKIDEQFENINYKVIAINKHFEKVQQLENEVTKYKKIIKRMEKKL